MASRSILRRYFSCFEEGIRDQIIDRANLLRAIKFSNFKIMKFGWYMIQMAIGRASLIKKRNAHYNEVNFL